MSAPQLVIDGIVNQLFAENTYILYYEGSSQCVLVDPGSDIDKLFEKLTEQRLTPHAMLITHGHSDHILGNADVKQAYPDCPVVIGHGDAYKLTDAVANLSAQYGISITSPPADVLLREGDRYSAADLEFEILETPGHSPGHIVFVLKSQSPWFVVGGDVLFQESIGRSDFPDGSAEDLIASIRDKLFVMPDDTIVLPGHGPHTTIGHEKQHNPFVSPAPE